ncbi:MAG: ParB/RepB/Spo0J family partition protein [Acidobacteriota bacterium]
MDEALRSNAMTCSTVRLDSIDWEDRSFEIPYFMPHDRLEASLRSHGIIHPPLVWALEGGRYVIVDGFKRLEWARKEGMAEVSCVVCSDGMGRRGIVLRRVEEKLFGPPLNVAEKARVALLLSGILSIEQIATDYLPRLGMGSRPEGVKRLLRLAVSEEALLQGAASEEVSERAALELAEWDTADRAVALCALKTLRCSASIQMEILERVSEIALREEASRKAVFELPELAGTLTDPDWNHRQKTQALRDALARLRYPRLKAREERFAREMAECSLPGNVRITPPPAFEGDRWQMSLFFSNPAELQAVLDQARTLALSPRFDGLMSPREKKSKK